MPKLLFIFFAVLFVRQINAQTAFIKDPDGFCNVRQSASSQSKVVDTLSNGKIVYVLEESAEGNWISIDYKKGRETQSAFVHKSRIIFLNSLPKFKTVAQNDSVLRLQLDTLQITITTRRFNLKTRQIKYEKTRGAYKWVKYIDGKHPWGIDGNVPQTEYQSVQFKSGGKTLVFPRTTFQDLLEPNLDETTAYIDKAKGKIYIEALNSDAAGAYVVIWTIKDWQIVDREIFIPF
jgi:hypothetical protein